MNYLSIMEKRSSCTINDAKELNASVTNVQDKGDRDADQSETLRPHLGCKLLKRSCLQQIFKTFVCLFICF